MKKIYFLVLGIILMTLCGCSSVPVRTELLSQTDKIVKIEVMQDFLECGVTLSIENLTDEVLEIDWNSSSLDGDSVIISGQLYNQRNTLLPKTVLAPYSKTLKSINKTSNINNFWVENGEKDLEFPAKLVLHISVKNKEGYVIMNLIGKIKK